MVSEEVLVQIDREIKLCWKKSIRKDYWDGYLLKEDSLKCALYFHLRRKLDKVLRENSLRIYPEYYISELKYRADIVIVQIDEQKEYKWLKDSVTDVVALFELKYVGARDDATLEWVKSDLWKFKEYINVVGLNDCQFYFSVIYENECSSLNWLDARSTNNWAKGRVTELNAGVLGDEMTFEVNSYNNLNESLND